MQEGCERMGLVVTITVNKLDTEEHVRRRRMHHAVPHAPRNAHTACSANFGIAGRQGGAEGAA